MNFGLTISEFDEIVRILSGYSDIEEVLVFGSRSVGTNDKASDIDLAIKCKVNCFDIILKLKNDFDESRLPYFVDLIDYYKITNEKMKENVDLKGIKIYPV